MVILGLAGVLAASGKWNGRHSDNNDPLLRSIIMARSDWDFPGTLAVSTLGTQKIYSVGAGPRKILLIGDSHVKQYAPRLNALLENTSRDPATISFITADGCPAIMHVTPDAAHKWCSVFQDTAIKFASENNFDTIVWGGFWNGYFLPNVLDYHYASGDTEVELASSQGTEAALHEMGQQINLWAQQNKKVYLLLDIPFGSSFKPRQLVHGARWGTIHVDHFSSRVPLSPEQARLHERIRNVALSNGAQVIDPIPVLCPDNQCLRATSDGTPIYKDNNHLRASYAREQATWMDILISP
jgi:hypothetical protein